MNTITAERINKSYGPIHAVRDISLSVEKAELFGLIGPDGSGKTTLFRIFTTLLLPDSGQATVNGLDVIRDYRKIRECVGYMPGRFSLYQDLTVEENLRFFATVFGTTIEENYSLIEDIYKQIEPFKNRRAEKLSGGMKQKLALSCALIHRPTVLFLDEPTTGVDPVSRKEFWEILKKLKQEGITILVSTPYMDEAVRCDRIALFRDGSILNIETPQEIINQYKETLWTIRATPMPALLKTLRRTPGVKTCFSFGDSHHATIDTELLTQEHLYDILQMDGFKDIEIKTIKAGIEDCYMSLSQNKLS